ncbi:MAG: hypothetical protein GX895_14315 [Clostridiales bacterium]|nr:hypothetical protein [Clostridiales bacterium]
MGTRVFYESDFDSNIISKLEHYANKLILALEDIIEIISDCGEANSSTIKKVKEKYEVATNYLLDLKSILDLYCKKYKDEDYNYYKKELEVYDDEYINDAITGWILNEPREIIIDNIFSICYKVRELLRKSNNKQ